MFTFIREHSILTLPLVYLIQKNGSFCDFKINNDILVKSVSAQKITDNNFCKYTNPVKLVTVWQIAYFTYAYAIPALILIIAYSKILFHLKVNTALENVLSARTRTTSPRTSRDSIPKQNRKKITSLIQTLVASYLFCYSPYFIWTIGLFIGWPKSMLLESESINCVNLMKIFQTMVFLNSALNPILYSLLNSSFNARLKLSFKNMGDQLNRRPSTGFIESRNGENDVNAGKIINKSENTESRFSPPINQYTRKLSIFNDPFMKMRSKDVSENSELIEKLSMRRTSIDANIPTIVNEVEHEDCCEAASENESGNERFCKLILNKTEDFENQEENTNTHQETSL